MKLNRWVGCLETLSDNDVLRVEISQNYVVSMEMTELIEYLIGDLTDTILGELLSRVCQSVQIGVSLVYERIQDIHLIFKVKG